MGSFLDSEVGRASDSDGSKRDSQKDTAHKMPRTDEPEGGAVSSTPVEPLGLRQRKKQEAMARMRAAARDLMWDRGYDDVTTKEIAARADVGLSLIHI